MKKISFIASVALVALFTSCGPAAEDRQAMHARAKVFQDSIANVIRTTMAEAEAPANVVAAPVQTAAPSATPATPPAK